MGKKRDRIGLINDILRVIKEHNNSIKPTPLLRYSNLSSQGFQEYISELIKKGFITEITDKKGRKAFSLTDKGFLFLQKYQTIRDFIDDFGL
jgi:predicted transcriptional regulator